MRPNAVVINASAIPEETDASDPPPPDAAMPVNALTIPITVPSRPTNGAVEPVVARMPRPRFSSADTIRISRSTARSTELMSAAVMVARSRSSGFTSESASPTTRATWLFFCFSAMRIAPSSCSSCRKRENSGANFRVSRWERKICTHFWTAFAHEMIDMINRMITIDLANGPIETNRS